MHLGDLKATFQHLKEGYKKDGGRFFSRTCSDRTRGNGFKLKEIMDNKPRCCFSCFCCSLHSAFGSPGSAKWQSSFSQMKSWDCLHFHLIMVILIHLCTFCPTYCWAVLVVWCALLVYQKMSTALKYLVILAKAPHLEITIPDNSPARCPPIQRALSLSSRGKGQQSQMPTRLRSEHYS